MHDRVRFSVKHFFKEKGRWLVLLLYKESDFAEGHFLYKEEVF